MVTPALRPDERQQISLRSLLSVTLELRSIILSKMQFRVLISWLALVSGMIAQTCSTSNHCENGCCNSYGWCGFGPDCEFQKSIVTILADIGSLRRELRHRL
jgi:hypothetical protein